MPFRPFAPSGEDRGAPKGFVLVAVIWLAGLIAAVAAGFAVATRVNIVSSSVTLRNTEAELAADGMTRLVAFRLATEPFRAPETAESCRWNGDINVAIAIQDQAGLVDLNAAPEPVLARLLAGLGVSRSKAESIAAAIADFRDADQDASAGGREPERYGDRNFGPKNAPFQAIEEIDQIPGIDEALYRRLLPFLTVHSLQAGIDPAAAPAELKRLLGFGTGDRPPDDLAGLTSASPARTFGIDVAAASVSSRYRRLAIVDLIRQPDRPYAVLRWQRGGDFAIMGEPVGDCLN